MGPLYFDGSCSCFALGPLLPVLLLVASVRVFVCRVAYRFFRACVALDPLVRLLLPVASVRVLLSAFACRVALRCFSSCVAIDPLLPVFPFVL